MPIDIADLSEEKFPPKFIITTERLGELGFRALYGIDYPYLMFGTSTCSDEEAIGKLMEKMGWRMEGLERLTKAHRAALTAADMEMFCRALIEHVPTIFDGNPRKDDEDWLAYVRRAGGEAVETRKEPFKKSALLDIEDSYKRNVGAVSHMRSILNERSERIELPSLPHNPILDTNFILKRMADLTEAGAEQQVTLNDYASSAIAEMRAGAEQTERNAKLALWVSLAGVATGVLGALVAAGTWVWTADQQSKAEVIRKANVKAASLERQADRELMQRQLEAMQRNADELKKLSPTPGKKAERILH